MIKTKTAVKVIPVKLKTIVITLVLVSFCGGNLFAQNIGEKTGNAFLDYMHGRSLFGINFGPTLYAGLFDIGVGQFLAPQIESMLGGTEFAGSGLKHYAFGLGFSYDFAPLNFMTVGLDIGFSVGEMSLGEEKIKFSTVPWSINVKFFFWKNAPFGFFLSPRFGGTALSVNASGSQIASSGIPSKLYSHGGFYMSVELGWRIQLFPKMGANWPVQVGIDVSLFDLGYYVAPWTSSLFNNMQGIEMFASFKEYQVFANIRALILPRIAITLRF